MQVWMFDLKQDQTKRTFRIWISKNLFFLIPEEFFFHVSTFIFIGSHHRATDGVLKHNSPVFHVSSLGDENDML